MEAINHALQVAGYRDIVEVQVEDETVYLGASIDLANGGIQWQPIEPEQRLARHLQTKQWILPMLNDETRNNCYQEAIQKATDVLNAKFSAMKDDFADDQSPPKIRVLDIGTGSGLLALMVARNLASSSVVHSLEMSTNMADLARLVIEANKDHISKDTDIHVLTEHSTEYQSPHRAQFCVSELLESGLLGEGVMPALRDAWDRLLEPDALMIPQGAHIYVAAVQGAWIQDLHGPHHHHHQHGHSTANSISYALNQQHDESSHMLDARQVAYPVHARHVFCSANGRDDCRILTDAKQALGISFQRDALLNGQQASSAKATLTCTHAGTIHGILVWWDLDLWDGITYSLDPRAEAFSWQDHWKPCIHPIVGNRHVKEGDTVSISVSHDEDRIFVAVCDGNGDVKESTSLKRQRSLAGEQSALGNRLISSERALQMNDHERLAFYKVGIQEALSIKGKDAKILDLSDLSLCACVAARVCGATRVISLESAAGDISMTAARMCQLGNGLPLDGTLFEILQCQAEQLTLALVGGSPIDIIVAEPYYQMMEGWHICEAINYYSLIRALRQRGVLTVDSVSVPGSCRVMGCAIESEQLRSAYSPCGNGVDGSRQSVCGFDHTAVNQHGANFELHELSLPLWQYDYERISADVELCRLDFCHQHDVEFPTTTSISMTRKGTVDAVLFWLEYCCGDHGLLSMAERKSYRLSVRMMNKSRRVDAKDMLGVTTTLLRQSAKDGFVIEVR